MSNTEKFNPPEGWANDDKGRPTMTDEQIRALARTTLQKMWDNTDYKYSDEFDVDVSILAAALRQVREADAQLAETFYPKDGCVGTQSLCGEKIAAAIRQDNSERPQMEKDAEMLAWYEKRCQWYQGELDKLKAHASLVHRVRPPRLRGEPERDPSCATHGDPLVCLACEADESARPEWQPPNVMVHVCSGCHHRWTGDLKGAELCGDCWRKGQGVILGSERHPDASLVQEMEPYLQHTAECDVWMWPSGFEGVTFSQPHINPKQACSCGLALLRRSAAPVTPDQET